MMCNFCDSCDSQRHVSVCMFCLMALWHHHIIPAMLKQYVEHSIILGGSCTVMCYTVLHHASQTRRGNQYLSNATELGRAKRDRPSSCWIIFFFSFSSFSSFEPEQPDA